MTPDDCTMGRDELWAEVQRLEEMQRGLLKECKRAMNRERARTSGEVKRWKVLCDEYKNDINAISEKLYRFQRRESLVEALIRDVLRGDAIVKTTALAVRDFGPCGGGE